MLRPPPSSSSLVTSRAIFFKIFPEKSVHRTRHTVKGWSVWIAVVASGWIIAFIIGEVRMQDLRLILLVSS
jgi:hypothetical protein